MKNRYYYPPKLLLHFFRWYCHPELVTHIEGDLMELYDQRLRQSGKKKADLNFLIDVLLLFRPGIIRSARIGNINEYAMYKSYVKIGWRNILKSKIYSSINIGGLAIGMAAAMLIILYVKDELQYDRFHEKSPVLYRVVHTWTNPDGSIKQRDGITGNFQGPKFKEAVPEIVHATRWDHRMRTFKINNELSDKEVCRTEPDFFKMFSFPFLAGNPATALKEPNSIVITEEKAKQLFNTTDALGRILEIKGESRDPQFESFQVTGVVKNIPSNSSIKFEFIMPFILSPEEYANNENWFNFYLNTFVELHPSANPRVVESKMQEVYEKDAAPTIQMSREKYDVVEKAQYSLQPVTDMHLNTIFTAANGLQDASNPMFSYILSGVALFILLIACVNFINLSIARSLKRAREIGVRKVVGGSRWNLTLQFLSESFLISFFAFAVAIVLVQLILPVFNTLAVKSISMSSMMDSRLIIAYVVLFVVTGLTAGFYPSLILSRFNPVKTLYGRMAFSGNSYLQKGLVITQFTLASTLIMGTMVIYKQFDFMTTKDLGYDDKDLMLVDKFGMNQKEFDVFKNALKSHPSILDVASKNMGDWGTLAKVNNGEQIEFSYNIIDDSYFPLLKIPVIHGRTFSQDFSADSLGSVIVNEAFVKKAGWKDPLGQQVDFWFRNAKYSVVGVVKDHHFNSLAQEISPQLFIQKPDERFGTALIKVDGANKKDAIAHVEKTFKAQFPEYTFSYRFKDEMNKQQYQLEARWKEIILAGSVLTIFISCIGLLGLATLTAERRKKEIGIRKVFGASVSNITRLLSSNFMQLVIIAFIVSIPAAYSASNMWLKNYAYRIDFSAWIVLSAIIITGSIAIIPIAIQATRAAMTNPAMSLRSE